MRLKTAISKLWLKKSNLGLFLVIIYFVLILYSLYYALNCGDFLCGFSLVVVLLGPWIIFINELESLGIGWLIMGLIAIFNAAILYYLGVVIENINKKWVLKRKTS